MAQSIPFCNTVRSLINAIDEFHRLLERESEALTNGKLDGLSEISREKMLLSEQLDRLDRQRRAAIGKRDDGVSDLQAMSEALAQCDNSHRLIVDWKAALDKLQQCRRMNDHSGATIHAQTRHTQRALELLAGDVAAAVTYGPGAASNMTHRSKEFGLA